MSLQDYRIRRPLPHGEGDHLAMDAEAPDGRRVLLKQYAPLNRGGRDRWAAAIRHGVASPHVVACLDAGVREDLDAPWAAWEWVDFAPVRPGDLRPVIEAVLRGLAAAHARGIAHLDVRAGYILAGKDGVKLGHLGYGAWAASVREEPRPGPGMARMRHAPFDHLAPEQATGVPAGKPADVWHVGALALRLAGVPIRPAFEQKEIIERIMLLMQPVEPAVLDAAPPPWRAWIATCLAHEPARRFADAAAALAALPG